jgi:dihydroflavonol-4-reductase
VPPSASPENTPLLDESHAWNYLPERWPYAFAKHSSELEVLRAVEDGLQAVIVCPSAVFGAGDWYRTSKSLVAHLGRGAWVPQIDGGLNAVHIDDVVAGHLAAVERGRTGERYILGGENLTLPEMFRITAQVVGRRPPRLRIPLRAVPAVRRLLQPARSIMRLPIEPSLLWLAGYYFFYDTHKATVELGLPPARSYRQAAEDTLGSSRAGAVPEPAGGCRQIHAETLQARAQALRGHPPVDERSSTSVLDDENIWAPPYAPPPACAPGRLQRAGCPALGHRRNCAG